LPGVRDQGPGVRGRGSGVSVLRENLKQQNAKSMGHFNLKYKMTAPVFSPLVGEVTQ